MRYEPFGPFVLQRERYKPSAGAFPKLWREVKAASDFSIANAVGIYLLAVREKGHKPLPWYVGRTCEQGFKRRFTQKLKHFNEILTHSEHGQLEISFLALMTASGKKLSKTTSKNGGIGANQWLERRLIGDCYELNRNLINVSDAKYLKAMVVPGYLNSTSDEGSGSTNSLRELLG